MAKEFKYEDETYQIDASRRVDSGGDIDPNTKTMGVLLKVGSNFVQ